jgi:hypothetical protein
MSGQIMECSELFFSEYVEGSYQNKAIEVYNPTNATIDLSNYTVERFSNGNNTSNTGGVTTLTGMLASGDAFVLTNGETDTTSTFGFCSPILVALGDMAEPNGSYPTPMHMNGNDAIVLYKNGIMIDVIGKVGQDPAIINNPNGGWTTDVSANYTDANDSIAWTMDHTLIRKSTVLNGDIIGNDDFDPSIEWEMLEENTWTNLGSHICNCTGISSNENKDVSYVMYPNPANSGVVVSINANTTIKNIILTSVLGQQVRFDQSINTSGLAKGAYVVDIHFLNGDSANNKLIID